MQSFTYPVKLTRDKQDGGFVVTCRDIPEVVTQGGSIDDALDQAAGALEAAVETRIIDGMAIPLPSEARRGEYLAALPVNTAMTAALHLALQESGISKSELARLMALDEKEARRILNPKHATRIATMERALHLLGKRVEVVVE